eukprot:TRINITY_DN35538_c0_g1_i1.p1 TRINITY_DN35538_c0_g1~~TRINITY_DN35538_c0_g1_i1.p1  ORF type:complete len:264 (+),score=45.61 TRINITY_DN35538_c0_g1_i1:43-834(+)
MSKLNAEILKTGIDYIIDNKKERKFLETVELQINLKDYDPQKDKRFSGTVKLPNIPRPKMKICIIGDAAHIEEASKLGIDTMSVEGLKKFNKNKKQIKKWAKKYKVMLGTDTLVKQVPKLCGPILNRIGRFPVAISHSEPLEKKLKEIQSSVKFQLKKVLCMGIAIANVGLSKEEIRQNIVIALNFLISLLKKGWNNIKTLYIKTTMGKSYRIHGQIVLTDYLNKLYIKPVSEYPITTYWGANYSQLWHSSILEDPDSRMASL